MRATLSIAATAVLMVSQVHAASVPNTFSSGDPANASEVNANFNSLISDIEAVETSLNNATSATFGSYFIPPSSDGTLGVRNVIVLKDETNSCYVARVNFDNTTGEPVDTPSGSTTPDQIYVFQFVCGDSANVSYENEYVYALGSSGFEDGISVEINEDASDGSDGPADGIFETQEAYDYSFVEQTDSLGTSELRNGSDVFKDGSGELVAATNWARLISPLGESLTVNGMTFDDVVIENFLGIGRTRIRANGIGAVLEINADSVNGMLGDPVFNSSTNREVVYYRVDGSQDGSLTGTPFDGGPLINVWFQP